MIPPLVVDTHAHLCDPAFSQDLGAVLERAKAAGVSAVIAVGEDLADAKRNLLLSREHPLLRAAAGLYPAHIDLAEALALIDFIRAERSRLWAIGEVGLDHRVVEMPGQREIQLEIFSRFIDLSLELALPLNVHSRSAGEKAVSLLLQRGARKVQLHAFDGKASRAMPAAEAGFYFSIPPSVVRSRQKQKLVKRLPLTRLLLETDSPVLGPDPGGRNEPANLPLVVQAVAELKQVSEGEVLAAVWENTRALYGDAIVQGPQDEGQSHVT
jgi:TatD DNase family protein